MTQTDTDVIEAFWQRIESEPCAEGGAHEFVNNPTSEDEDGPWTTTCSKCWRNFEAELVDTVGPEKISTVGMTHRCSIHGTLVNEKLRCAGCGATRENLVPLERSVDVRIATLP